MKHSRQSHAARITLLACILVALLPSSGLAVCVGHGGDHLGIGVPMAVPLASGEAEGGESACPCATSSQEFPAAAQSPDPDDHHHPCRDVIITAPQLYFGGHGTTQKLAVPLDLDGGLPPADAILPARRPTASVVAPRTAGLGSLVSPALRDGRTVVLLI